MKPTASPTLAAAAFVAATLIPAPASHALPMYYTFEGSVIYTTTESRPLGMAVDFTFLVDRDLDGQTLDMAGNPSTVEDYVEALDYYTLSFYASYVGGSALPSDNPASEFNQTSLLGVEQRHYAEIFSALRGSNSDLSGFDLIDIWSTDLDFGDWHVGQSLLGENFVINGPGELNTSFSSALTLTSITDYNPIAAVPEPSTLSFMGLGLLGLGAAFWKRRKA
jgi:hypothetical protein